MFVLPIPSIFLIVVLLHFFTSLPARIRVEHMVVSVPYDINRCSVKMSKCKKIKEMETEETKYKYTVLDIMVLWGYYYEE
jgi:hypothetical protein